MNKKSIKDTIPVVFACDDNYIIPLYVSIMSMLGTAKEIQFDIYVLVPGEISERSKALLEGIAKKEKCRIELVNMGNKFDQVIGLPHITKATCFRLCIPEILQKYSKCIYLDCDILVTGNVAELYAVDVSDYYVAGVKEIGYHMPNNWENLEKLRNEMKLPDWNHYINAGVMVMNLERIRRDGLTTIMVKMAESTNFPSLDQDIINAVLYSKIKIIPLKYNAMTKYVANKNDEYSDVISKEELSEARENAIVLHYLTAEKPWFNKRSIMADKWWRYVSIIPKEEYIEYVKPFLKKCRQIWRKRQMKQFIKRLIKR